MMLRSRRSARSPADPHGSSFQRSASAAEESSAWAGCPVIAKCVEMSATTAGGSIKRQWKAESPEQENTHDRQLNPGAAPGTWGERCGHDFKRTCLRA